MLLKKIPKDKILDHEKNIFFDVFKDDIIFVEEREGLHHRGWHWLIFWHNPTRYIIEFLHEDRSFHITIFEIADEKITPQNVTKDYNSNEFNRTHGHLSLSQICQYDWTLDTKQIYIALEMTKELIKKDNLPFFKSEFPIIYLKKNGEYVQMKDQKEVDRERALFSVSEKYLNLRENAINYTNIDMNLKLENDEQIYLAVIDIPFESGLLYGTSKTLVLLFGLTTHIYNGNGDVLVDLKKDKDVMQAMQSLFISCSQVLKYMKMKEDCSFYNSQFIRVYLKTRKGTYFKTLDKPTKENVFLKMLINNVLSKATKSF